MPSNPLTRRTALKRGSLAAASAMLMTHHEPARADEEPAAGYIDAHSHVWTPDVQHYPLATGYKPADMKPPSFTPNELMEHARPCGVERVVLIQMSYYRFDNSYMLWAMREYPGTFSGVAVVDHHASDVRDTMRSLRKQGVRGFRIHPGSDPVDMWLGSDAMAAFWGYGADENLAMCGLVNPDALVPLDKMCQRFPRTPVVIDHFARIGVDGTIRTADVDNLCRLARHENTHVKVSAFYALGKKQSPYLDLGPMIRRLVDAYGPQRLMWATDCPYQVQNGHTYRDSVELIRTRLDSLSSDDRQWLLRKTAEKVFFS